MAEHWIPHAYQKKAVRWLLQHPEAALFVDVGLGKTAITLSAFLALQKSRAVRKMLVVAPLRVCEHVWSAAGEIGKWTDFADLRVILLHGGKKDNNLAEDGDIYVINYEGLDWLLRDDHLASLRKRGVDMLVWDELSKMKHHRTKRFKLIRPHLGYFKRRVGLTGTPAANGLLDLFGQVLVLDLGRRLGPYITKFRSSYFTPAGFGGYDWQPQPDAEKRIYAKLKDLAISIRAQDHLDLPTLVEQDVWCALPDAAQKIYRDMEDELIAQVQDQMVTAANAAVATGKCRQLAGGGLYKEKDVPLFKYEKDLLAYVNSGAAERRTLKIHDAKIEALQEILGELQGQPTLVAFQFTHELDRIREALGDMPALHGGQSSKDSTATIERWSTGATPVLLVHPASVAFGLNLQGAGCGHVIYYSLPWERDLYDQLNGRVRRQGATVDRVVVHRIFARKTIDEGISRALVSKMKTQDALLAELKRASWRA